MVHVMFVSNDFPMIFMQQYYFCVSEYCFQDDFNPRCGRDEVIVMTQAFYGRMKKGRCITRDLGYLGCKADVINILDKLCSNNQECDVDVPDILHDGIQSTCDAELMQYLEADYRCEAGMGVSLKITDVHPHRL